MTTSPSRSARCWQKLNRFLTKNLTPKSLSKKSSGFTLMEMMLGMVILAAGVFGVFRLLNSATANAEMERESKNFGALVEGVRGAYLADGTFDGLTTADVTSLGLPGVKTQNATLVSNFGGPVVIRPATVRTANDAFDIVYHELDEGQCVKLIKTGYAQSYQIYVNEVSDLSGAISTPGVEAQIVVGADEGRILNDGALTQVNRCGSERFEDGQGIVAFRIYTYQSADGVEVTPACVCLPGGATQNLACPVGYSGTITQERTNDCSGGTPECPAESWSAWVTTSNTCTEDPTCTTPPCGIGPPPPPPPSCNPYVQTRNLTCPPGESGVWEQSRNATCPDPYGDHVFTAWVTTQNTCVGDVNPPGGVCETAVETRSVACPAGQGGSITESRQSTCPDPTSSPVWGPWIETGNTCSTSCVVTNNCCAPSRENRTVGNTCGNGFYGSPSTEQERTSSCASATATPVWGAWYDLSVSGTCEACPAASTQTQTDWVAESGTCAGALVSGGCWKDDVTYYVGSAGVSSCFRTDICVYEIDTTLTHYRPNLSTDPWMPIPAGNQCGRIAESPLPQSAGCWVPGTGPGSFVSGATVTECIFATECVYHLSQDRQFYAPATDLDNWMPVNPTWVARCGTSTDGSTVLPPPTGSYSYEAEVSRSRTVSYNCPAGTTAIPAPTYGSWSSWEPTGARRNEIDTCSTPTSCTIPAGTARSWTVSGNTCNGPALGAEVTIANGATRSWTDSTAPTTGSASFTCNNGVLSTSPNAGATCTSAPVACTVAAGTVFNWTVGGQNCTFTSGAQSVAEGGNLAANDSTQPSTGSATFACSGGVMSATPNAGATCDTACQVTSAVPRSWTVGGALCSTTYGGATVWVPHNGLSTFNDTSPVNTGSAQFRCNQGTLAASENQEPGATCASSSCSVAAGTVFNWTVGGQNCTFTSGAQSVAEGGNLAANDSTQPSTGSATFACSGGVMSATPNAGATCNTRCEIPAGTARNWTVSGNTCNGPALGAITYVNHGASQSWTDSVAPTTGTAAFACNQGTLAASPNAGATCATSSCNVAAGTVFNWTVGGQNCTFTSGAQTIATGNTLAATDAIQPSTGSATFTCTNGVMSATANAGASCNTRCEIPVGTTRNWTVGGNTCNGPALGTTAFVNHGASQSWTDSTAPTTGTATYACNQGVLSGSPSSATCVNNGCNITAGQTFNWTVGGLSCTANAPSSVNISNGNAYSISDVTNPNIGDARFQCNSGTISATAMAGATCYSNPCGAGTKPGDFQWNLREGPNAMQEGICGTYSPYIPGYIQFYGPQPDARDCNLTNLLTGVGTYGYLRYDVPAGYGCVAIQVINDLNYECGYSCVNINTPEPTYGAGTQWVYESFWGGQSGSSYANGLPAHPSSLAPPPLPCTVGDISWNGYPDTHFSRLAGAWVTEWWHWRCQ